jgi:hypothetical protein
MAKGDKRKAAEIQADLAQWVQQFREGCEDPAFTNFMVDAAEAMLTGKAKSIDHALGLITRGTNTPLPVEEIPKQISFAVEIMLGRIAGKTFPDMALEFQNRESQKEGDEVSEKQLSRILERHRTSASELIAGRIIKEIERRDAAERKTKKSPGD